MELSTDTVLGEPLDLRAVIEPSSVRSRSDLSKYLSQSLLSEYHMIQDDVVRQSSTFVKSYLVEVSESESKDRANKLQGFFSRVSATDDKNLFLARDKKDTPFFVDTRDERFLIVHSIARTEDTDSTTKRLTDGSVEGFDRAWLPTQFLLHCHLGVMRGFKFSHAPLAAGISLAEHIAPDRNVPVALSDEYQNISTRESVLSESIAEANLASPRRPVLGATNRSTMTVKDSNTAERDYSQIRESRVFEARRSLDWLQYQAVTDDGLDINHSLYSHGKITANGTSAALHLHAVEELKRTYATAIRNIESEYAIGWVSTATGRIMTGEPLLMKFSPNVTVGDLYSLAKSIFRAARPFRLFGFPHRISTSRLDVEAVDLHTGDEFSVELTPEWMRIYLPKGSCGNVVARLLTNMQHSMDSETLLYGGSGEILFAGPSQ